MLPCPTLPGPRALPSGSSLTPPQKRQGPLTCTLAQTIIRGERSSLAPNRDSVLP